MRKEIYVRRLIELSIIVFIAWTITFFFFAAIYKMATAPAWDF